MFEKIPNMQVSGWFLYDLALERHELLRLASALEESVLFDGTQNQANQQYLILTALPERTWQPSDIKDIEEINLAQRQFKQEAPKEFEFLPFVCGIIGYCGYGFGERLHGIKPLLKTGPGIEEAQLRYYSWSYVYDLQTKKGWLAFSPTTQAHKRSQILNQISNSQNTSRSASTLAGRADSWHAIMRAPEYKDCFFRIKDYILDGDVYQINLTQAFSCELNGDIYAYYEDLKKGVDAPYCSLYTLNANQHILSFSPEQFISIVDGVVTTKPIKGTISSAESDSATTLSNSTKDKAENLMIVDLLRNDLSQFCQLNTVSVPKLFEIETHKNLHHLVSTVTGKIRSDITPLSAFLSSFPGGSITGAPKKRAMEIISELELSARSAYCGSIFYWSDNGSFDSNILIRTIVHDRGKLFCWGGGGIVADSECDKEYLESFIKVEHLIGRPN